MREPKNGGNRIERSLRTPQTTAFVLRVVDTAFAFESRSSINKECVVLRMKYSTLITLRQRWPLLLLLLLGCCCDGYVPQKIQEGWKKKGYNIDKALSTIEECAQRGDTSDELYGAVRYIDRNAHHIYSDPKEKQALWERAQGSWGTLCYRTDRLHMCRWLMMMCAMLLSDTPYSSL